MYNKVITTKHSKLKKITAEPLSSIGVNLSQQHIDFPGEESEYSTSA